jgi:hypothetical protein
MAMQILYHGFPAFSPVAFFGKDGIIHTSMTFQTSVQGENIVAT